MNFTIHTTEQYNLVDFLTDAVDANDLALVESELREGLAETPYLILDLSPIRMLGVEAMEVLNNMARLLESEEGLLIAAAPEKSLIDKLTGIQVQVIPTVDEAVDYVFMDQLEKELGREDL